MFRQIIVTFLWAVGVLLGSQMLLAFLSGAFFFGLAMAYGDSATGDLIAKWIVRLFMVVSIGLTVATVVFGIKGQLPGARTTSSSAAV